MITTYPLKFGSTSPEHSIPRTAGEVGRTQRPRLFFSIFPVSLFPKIISSVCDKDKNEVNFLARHSGLDKEPSCLMHTHFIQQTYIRCLLCSRAHMWQLRSLPLRLACTAVETYRGQGEGVGGCTGIGLGSQKEKWFLG